jgi:dienelactone hydrolase
MEKKGKSPKKSLTTSRITIVPDRALIDEPVNVRLFGFTPHQRVTIRAQLQDDAGRLWGSYATFKVDKRGSVDVSVQKPVSGTYNGLDPQGLFWSMKLNTDEDEAARFTKTGLAPTVITFTAEVESKHVASASLKRLFVTPGVTAVTVLNRGLVGAFFHPQGSGPRPGIIVVGGMDGGLVWAGPTAALLASRGYAALALAYHKLKGLPEQLVEIPLEYFETALRWMQEHDAVVSDKLAVMGHGRGGELALLLGATFPQLSATFPQLSAVVGYAPSGIVWQSIGQPVRSPWSYRGAPLPFVPLTFDPSIFASPPVAHEPIYVLKDDAETEKATIPVEKIRGAVLLIAGADDQLWPSSLFSERVIDRLAAHHFSYPYKYLKYPGAGHLFDCPYAPATVTHFRDRTTGLVIAVGGTTKDQAWANVDSWHQVCAFLGEYLK